MSDQHALEANGAEPDSVDPVAEFRAALASRVGDWYVVHTYAGYENRVKANLETRIQSLNMEDYIFEIDVPMEEVTEIKNGQKKIVRRVRMPGYVLVRMDMTDASWGAVRHTPGVTGFVGWGACAVMAAELAPLLPLAWALARGLDALSLGEATARRLGNRHRQQGECRRACLKRHDPRFHRDPAVNAGNDHANQKKHLDMYTGDSLGIHRPPHQPCGEKAVVEPLVGGQHPGRLGPFRRVAEDPEALGPGPEEHFEVEEIQVLQRHEQYQSKSEGFHSASAIDRTRPASMIHGAPRHNTRTQCRGD